MIVITSDNNICHTKSTKLAKKSITNDKYVKIWQYKTSKIIYHNIPHTPSKVGVVARKTFSHTPDEAMSDGLAKACGSWKNVFC